MFKQIRNRADWSDKSVSQKGFTLIELLVVIAILGILAVVGVLSFGGLTSGAHTATAHTELAEVQTAADAYRALNNAIPTNTAVLQTGTTAELKPGALLCVYDIDQTTGTVTFDPAQPTADAGNGCA
jgi:prepilin-type N-terminal cleavage/methylation domain-containing protein